MELWSGGGGIYFSSSVPSRRICDESKITRFRVCIFWQMPMCFSRVAGTKVLLQIGHGSNSKSAAGSGITTGGDVDREIDEMNANYN